MANFRVGEVVLLGIIALGSGDLEDLELNTVMMVVSAFWQVGLKEEAQTLALEAALMKGF